MAPETFSSLRGAIPLRTGPERVVAAGSSGRAVDQRGPFRVPLAVVREVPPGCTQDSAPGGEGPTSRPRWLSTAPACRRSQVPASSPGLWPASRPSCLTDCLSGTSGLTGLTQGPSNCSFNSLPISPSGAHPPRSARPHTCGPLYLLSSLHPQILQQDLQLCLQMKFQVRPLSSISTAGS